MNVSAAVAARRVLLTADELDLLRRLAGDLRLPADFRMEPRPRATAAGQPAGMVGRAAAGMVESLRERDLVRPDPLGSGDPDRVVVHPSVRANLAVLAAAEVLIETRIRVDHAGAARIVQAAHAVAGDLGASLVRVGAAAAAELSIFPPVGLGAEVHRMVPQVGSPDRAGERPALSAFPPVGLGAEVHRMVPRAGSADRAGERPELSAFPPVGLGAEVHRIAPRAGSPDRAGERPDGAVPIAALTLLGPALPAGPGVVAEVAAGLRLGAAELSRASALLAVSRGVLHATVLGRPRTATEPLALGQVLWYATGGGWVGLAAEPGARGEASVRLLPVEPEDLGHWLAPLVGQAIR